jgi:hypothetical protein
MGHSAMECLARQASRQTVDPDVVRTLLHVVSLYPIGSYVSLNDGSVARVLRTNGNLYTTPIVQLMQTSDGNSTEDDRGVIDLANSALKIQERMALPVAE